MPFKLFTNGYKNILLRKLGLCALFAISMAYLESAVVVYLRAIYYPSGFNLPMADILPFHLWTETGREAVTLIMLIIVSRLASANRREWFAFFSFNFAMWDIWYYIWLKILLNWPASLFDWDILFLIPVPWAGPVLAPILVSIALIFSALIILIREGREKPVRMTRTGWLLESAAGLIIIGSFCLNKGVPDAYPWWLFALGMLVGTGVFARYAFQVKKS